MPAKDGRGCRSRTMFCGGARTAGCWCASPVGEGGRAVTASAGRTEWGRGPARSRAQPTPGDGPDSPSRPSGQATPARTPDRNRSRGRQQSARRVGARCLTLVGKFVTHGSDDALSCPGRCLTLLSHLMLDSAVIGFAVACWFAGCAWQGAGIGAGGFVGCGAAVSGGAGGRVGGAGDRGRGPVRGVAAERSFVGAPVSG